VLVVAVAALTLAALGPGTVSADAVLGVVDYGSWQSSGLIGLVAVIVAGFGGLIGAVGGLIGAVVLLGTGWRPARRSDG